MFGGRQVAGEDVAGRDYGDSKKNRKEERLAYETQAQIRDQGLDRVYMTHKQG